MRLTITGLSIDYARKARAGMSPFCAVLTLLAAGSLPVHASTVGLCNTGFALPTLTNPCGTLVNNQVAGTDGNYKLVLNPNNPSTNAWVVLSPPVASYPLPPWMPDTPISEWIGPAADQALGGGCCASGVYDYMLPFSTTGVNETIGGRWASDNNATMVLDMLLSTSKVVSLSGSFTAWTTFSFVVPGPGPHTLDFQVTNISNATGLRVEFVPEPSAFSLLGGGLALVLLGRRKFISRFFVGTLG
jgi:hypothetical protein